MSFSPELFAGFCREYPELLKVEERSDTMDDDMQFAAQLQRERLKKRGLELNYVITPRGHFPEGGKVQRTWSDGMYTNRMDVRSCNTEREILSSGKRIFRDRQDKLLYITAVDLLGGSRNVEKEPYICPNCGNVSTIGALRGGCPYCGTHFEISQLYPRVGGYYYVKEIGGTEKEVYGEVKKHMLPTAVILGVFGLISGILGWDKESTVLSVLGVIFMTAFSAGAGAIMGYMIWAIRKLGGIFYEAGKALMILPGVLGSRKKFEQKMMTVSPEFSYDYFVNKVGTIAKQMIFSDDPAKLPICVGEHVENPYSDVVDAQFRGVATLKSFRQEGNMIHVRVAAEFDLLRKTAIGYRNRRQFVTLALSRDISTPLRMNYSIKKVSCRGCGGSFDATRTDRCPYCGREYDIRSEDWFVTAIR